MDGIRLRHDLTELVLHRSRSYRKLKDDCATAWQPIDMWDIDSARCLLWQARDQLQSMRSVLAALGSASADVSRLTDDQVIDHVASKLAQRQWLLLKRLRRAEIPVQRAAIPRAVVPAVRSTSSAIPSRTHVPLAPTRAPTPSKTEFVPVDEDEQAATLRLAAANGTPFCEVCEKRNHGQVDPRRHQGAG